MLVLSDGHKMPQIGFGVAGIREPGATTKMVGAALEAGYRLIDNASIYENEAEVGVALTGSDVARSEVFLTSKVWPDMYGFDAVQQSFKESAARLQVETLDLYLLHWPAPELGSFMESWRGLIALQEQGLVRSIGVSNFYPNQLETLIAETGVAPVLNQIECHPYYQRPDERAFHAAHTIATQCWSPLGRSTCLDDPVIVEIADGRECTPAQVVLSWALGKGLSVIPRSRSIARMQENFALGDVGLGASDMAKIDGLDRGLEGRLGPDQVFA